jgi:hypothetical protein
LVALDTDVKACTPELDEGSGFVIRVRRRLIVPLVCLCGFLASAGTASAAQLLYGADGAGGHSSNLYILNQDTGAVIRTVGPIGFAVTGLAIDPTTGTLYGATGRSTSQGAPNPVSLITINRTTGAGTLVGKLRPINEGAADLTFTPDGTLYGWLEPGTDDLITINKATGAATIVGNSGLNTYGSGLASNSGGTLFFAGEGEQGPLRTVDRNTGLTTQVATLNGPNGGPGISALAFDAAGTLFGSRLPSDDNVGFVSDLLTINTSTGAITSKGPSVDRLDAIVFVPPRSVVLKKKLKNHGEKVRLFGQISDPGDPTCIVGQTVQVQRKKLGAAKTAKKKKRKFKTFRNLTTNQAGTFSTKTKVNQSFKYRAFLPESNACDDATSKVKKVKA